MNCSEAARWCRAASPMTRSTGFRLPCKAARYTVVEIYAPQIQASEIVMHDKAEIETSGEVSGDFHCVSEVCSPQAWGWPDAQIRAALVDLVFPTGVGMARHGRPDRRSVDGVPHRRGDGPRVRSYFRPRALCSPQAWGWPVDQAPRGHGLTVFPTGVGMAR